MTNREIHERVKELTERFETSEPFSLCRRMGVQILFVPLTRRVRAFYQQIDGVDIIYLSDDLSEPEQTLLLSHELGHCVLHQGLNSFFITRSTLFPMGRYEREADEFARCLLTGRELDLSCADSEIRKILLS